MNPITIMPAIDLKDGQCVRLRQGRASDVTVYSADPVDMARRWQAEGADALHVVDLDGAFAGHPVHSEIIAAIAAALTIPVQVGGGLRTDADIETLLSRGVSRVVIGTRALVSPDDLARLAKRFGSGLAVGIDARDGKVQIQGWTQTTEETAVDMAVRMDRLGVRTLIYTDISRDGMLGGVNREGMRTLCDAVSCRVIASGGISSTDDIRALTALGQSNLVGAIVGKALYEGRVRVADLKAAATDGGVSS